MRISGLGAATILSVEQQTKAIAPLEKDADPLVSKLATALVARAKAAATQPSTTQPASNPASTTPATQAAP
jgi:hypothetical protein